MHVCTVFSDCLCAASMELSLWPSHLLSILISLQADFIHDCLFLLFSPLFGLHAIAYHSFIRIETLKQRAESTVVSAVEASSDRHLRRKLGLGLRGAALMAVLLVAPVVPAAVLGFGLVHLWAEETVTVTETLHFDYTCVHPRASFSFTDSNGLNGKMSAGVPLGHTLSVSVALYFPESEYNKKVGMFQLTVEVFSKNGDVISKASQPCLLPFRSSPARLTETAITIVPLLLGATSETQKMTVTEMVKHKEGDQKERSEVVRVSMIQRWAAKSVPQLKDAEIILVSSPPWSRRVAHRWRLSLFIWVSFAAYFTFVAIAVINFRSLVFPAGEREVVGKRRAAALFLAGVLGGTSGEEGETTK